MAAVIPMCQGQINVWSSIAITTILVLVLVTETATTNSFLEIFCQEHSQDEC